MKNIARIYDNPHLKDRYTVILNDGKALALSDHPDHPNGMARWIIVDEYDQNQLGNVIEYHKLPSDVQQYVQNQLK